MAAVFVVGRAINRCLHAFSFAGIASLVLWSLQQKCTAEKDPHKGMSIQIAEHARHQTTSRCSRSAFVSRPQFLSERPCLFQW